MSNDRDNSVIDYILSLYHLDRLCPKCKGPMEIENTVSCCACDLAIKTKVHIEMIQGACMRLQIDTRGMGPTSPATPPQNKKGVVKKTTRKKTSTKGAK